MSKFTKNMPQSRAALLALSGAIALGRKAKKWSESNLAKRAGISRNTLRKVEAGDPSVGVGIVFDCAALVGIDLLGDRDTLTRENIRIQGALSLMPERIREEVADDNF